MVSRIVPITFPDRMLDDLDRLVESGKFESRAEAVRQAVQLLLFKELEK